MIEKLQDIIIQSQELWYIDDDMDYLGSRMWKEGLTREEKLEMDNCENRLSFYRQRVKKRMSLIFDD